VNRTGWVKPERIVRKPASQWKKIFRESPVNYAKIPEKLESGILKTVILPFCTGRS